MPLDQLARVLELYAEQARIWSDELCPALADEGIVVSGIDDLGGHELKELVHLYEDEIYPVLTPLAVGPGQPFPYISALSVSLAGRSRSQCQPTSTGSASHWPFLSRR